MSYDDSALPFSQQTRHKIDFSRRRSVASPPAGKIRITVEAYVPSAGEGVVNSFVVNPGATDAGANTQYLVNLLTSQMQETGVPLWQPGDVVLVTFSTDANARAYTYVIESIEPWRTSGSRQVSRYALDTAWRYHRAALVMRSGRAVDDASSCVEGHDCTVDHAGEM